MAANITDKFGKASSGTRAEATTLTAIKNVAATSITTAALNGWDTTGAVHFQIYLSDPTKLDPQGNPTIIPGSQSDWKGIVSGNTISQLQLEGGLDTIYPIGSVVVCLPSAGWTDDLVEGILTSLNQDGTLKSAAVATGTANGSITTAKLVDASVTNAKLAPGATRLGINKLPASVVIANTYTTYLTVTANSTGRECEVDFRINLSNAASGADRTVLYQILCDGVAISPTPLTIGVPNVMPGFPISTLSKIVSSTPAAGSHTWILQLQASAASAVTIAAGELKVSEIA